MSLNKTPSFVGVDEKAGTFTIAFLASWYNADRCDGCSRFRKAVRLETRSVVAFCELIEKDKPCEITGIRYEVKQNVIET